MERPPDGESHRERRLSSRSPPSQQPLCLPEPRIWGGLFWTQGPCRACTRGELQVWGHNCLSDAVPGEGSVFPLAGEASPRTLLPGTPPRSRLHVVQRHFEEQLWSSWAKGISQHELWLECLRKARDQWGVRAAPRPQPPSPWLPADPGPRLPDVWTLSHNRLWKEAAWARPAHAPAGNLSPCSHSSFRECRTGGRQLAGGPAMWCPAPSAHTIIAMILPESPIDCHELAANQSVVTSSRQEQFAGGRVCGRARGFLRRRHLCPGPFHSLASSGM